MVKEHLWTGVSERQRERWRVLMLGQMVGGVRMPQAVILPFHPRLPAELGGRTVVVVQSIRPDFALSLLLR